jgi:3-oxoacyl-[acyl-carrier-protein] synthase-1
MAELICATCLSTISPVGLTPESAAAAMRAGINAFAELPYVESSGEPIVGAVVADIPPSVGGRARVVELLVRAVESACASLPAHLSESDLPVILCTREPERRGPKLSGIMVEVEARLQVTFSRQGSAHLASGHVAALEALDRARRLVGEGRGACLIAAVDTLIDARTLEWLDGTGRLKTSKQSDGVIPGEAASVVLVTAKPVTPSCVRVRGLGFSRETATVLNDEPLLATGMTAAARDALGEASISMDEVDFRLTDVAGESYAFEEMVLAQSRVMRRTRESQPLWHPAGSVGDVGAAAGLMQIAWAEQAFVRSYSPGPVAMAHASAAAGARAVAVLTR